MDELSERQAAILEFISRHCRDTGYPPTVREIGFAVGLASPSTVHAHLATLAWGGHHPRHPPTPRALFVRRAAEEAAAPEPRPRVEALPLIGSVAAGAPRLAEQDVEDWVSTPFEGDFVLRVTGDSMINAGILDGDLVVVRRASTADDGEIVVAQIEDEATVKRLRRVGGRVELLPENDAYSPIVADEITLCGVVVGVLRAL